MPNTIEESIPSQQQQASRSKKTPRKNPHSFDFYVDDFLGGTVHLTPEAVGAYVRLLCFQFSNGSIPDDSGVTARLCGCSVDELKSIWSELQSKFPIDPTDGKRRNERLASERSHKLEVRKKCTDSARARWTESPPDPPPKRQTAAITDKASGRSRMPMPSSIAEVENWCSANNVEIDSSEFFNYYASQGWKKANGKQVTDWHACARGWESRQSKLAESKANPRNMLFSEQQRLANDAALERVFG